MLIFLSLLAQQESPYPTQWEMNDGGGGGVAGLAIFVGVLLIFVAFPIWCIVDAIRRPPDDWQEAGQSKTLWIFLQFFVWGLASIIYLAAIRPRLTRAARELTTHS